MYQLNTNSKKETVSLENAPIQVSRRVKVHFPGLFIILALVVAVLLGCGILIETHLLSRTPESYLFLFGDKPSCSPDVADSSIVKYHSEHEYYSKLRDITPLEPPVFHGDHTTLCKNRIYLRRKQRSFRKCLPISGLKDPTLCAGADRMDVLKQNSSGTICHASVLHMLLVEVYEELQALGKSPVILYGSLLGAVRENGMIPFTEDADIGYSGRLRVSDDLQRLLWQKGYYLFFENIWRVCIAPTHPLGAKLYNPTMLLTSTAFAVPYLDLYYMNQQRHTGNWKIEEINKINGSNLVSDDKVRPFSQVSINNQQFDTVHDTKYFLERMYGEDYMTPKPRDDTTIPQILNFFKTNRIDV